jgi:hypothetical protein
MGKKDGQAGVLSEAARAIAAELEAASVPAEQLDLLAAKPVRSVSPADARRILNSLPSGAGVEGKKGRQAGSQNTLTKKVKEVIMATMGDPALARMRYVYHYTPQQLASEFGFETSADALKFQDGILADFQKLFHANAVPLDDDGRPALPMFSLQIGAQGPVAVVMQEGGKTVELPPWMRDPEVRTRLEKDQQKQTVTIDAQAQSHGTKSHDESK